MNISKEVRIGLMALVTIICAIFGYKFLKGNNLLGNSMDVFIECTDAKLIPRSAPVYYLGVEVGNVADITFPVETPNKALVKLTLKTPIHMPKSAIAMFFPNGVMGGTAIEIVFPTPCKGGDCAESGAYIAFGTRTMLQQMLGDPESMTPYSMQIKQGVAGAFDTLGVQIKDPNNELNKTFKSLQSTIQNLDAATKATQQLIKASSISLGATLGSVANITKNLESSNEQIRATIANFEKTSKNLSDVDLQKTTNGANEAIASLKKTLVTSETTIANLNGMVSQMQSNNGSLGKLMSSDSLYNNLNETVFQVQHLMQDVRLNPRRYVNLNPFKKYKTYVVPADDPLKDKKRQ